MATSGSSAIIGAIAAAVAIAAIIALLVGFEGGGYTGGVAGQPRGIVHGDEFVVPSPDLRKAGGPRAIQTMLANMRVSGGGISIGSSGVVSPTSDGAGGGGAWPGAGEVHVFAFTDRDELAKAFAQSSANRKMIFDTVDGSRLELGLPS